MVNPEQLTSREMFKLLRFRLISSNNKENSCYTDVCMVIILMVVIRQTAYFEA